MLNRSSILALAAIAASATVTLTSNSAFALRLSGGTTSTSGAVHVNPALTHVSPSGFASLPHLTPVSPRVTPVGPSLPPAVHLPATTPTLPPAVHLDHSVPIDCMSIGRCDPHDGDHNHDHDHDHDHDWSHHHHDWWVWWHQPRSAVVDYGSVSVGGVGTRVSAPSAPCNCLTKRYLDDGSVVFADLCTREQAMATPAELRAQAEGIVPQGDAPTTR
jgi:hypothetical protein